MKFSKPPPVILGDESKAFFAVCPASMSDAGLTSCSRMLPDLGHLAG